MALDISRWLLLWCLKLNWETTGVNLDLISIWEVESNQMLQTKHRQHGYVGLIGIKYVMREVVIAGRVAFYCSGELGCFSSSCSDLTLDLQERIKYKTRSFAVRVFTVTGFQRCAWQVGNGKTCHLQADVQIYIFQWFVLSLDVWKCCSVYSRCCVQFCFQLAQENTESKTTVLGPSTKETQKYY